MKSAVKWCVLSLTLVAVIVVSSVLYSSLTKGRSGGNLMSNDNAPQSSPEESSYGTVFPSPDFEVLDQSGNIVKLSDFKGKPIVLNFWATWCYYCTLEMPDFDKACKEFPNVTFLMVNATDNSSETVEKAKKYVNDNGFSFPVLFDINQEAVSVYNITGFPTTYFFDADGNIIARAGGMIDYETLVKGIGMITD